ncbi:MAG: invasion associated locus B family protein [Pseudomonadota bacterium]
MTMIYRFLSFGLVAFLTFAPSSAYALQQISKHRDWHVQVDDSGDTTCSAWTTPKTAKGNYTSRGEIYGFVSYTKGSTVPAIAFIMGYPIKTTSKPTARIGNDTYPLQIADNFLYANDAKTVEDMVAAMRRGERMVITSRSRRETLTTDSYSLIGFTVALRKALELCK